MGHRSPRPQRHPRARGIRDDDGFNAIERARVVGRVEGGDGERGCVDARTRIRLRRRLHEWRVAGIGTCGIRLTSIVVVGSCSRRAVGRRSWSRVAQTWPCRGGEGEMGIIPSHCREQRQRHGDNREFCPRKRYHPSASNTRPPPSVLRPCSTPKPAQTLDFIGYREAWPQVFDLSPSLLDLNGEGISLSPS